VKWHKYVMPKDHMMFVGGLNTSFNDVGAEATPDTSLRSDWATVTSTRTRHVDMNNPQTGIFQKDYDKLDEDPPRYERMIGVRCLPEIRVPDAWFYAKVLD
jgi:hypothetical protein